MGLLVAGIALAVAAAAALAALLSAKKDADKNFSAKDVASPVAACPNAGKSPDFLKNGADAIVKSDRYKSCPDAVKNAIHSKEFTDSEKKGLDEVLDKYK